MKGPHGKLVKPLAALLVVDLDGRLNVNAHGTLDLAKTLKPQLETTALTRGSSATFLAPLLRGVLSTSPRKCADKANFLDRK